MLYSIIIINIFLSTIGFVGKREGKMILLNSLEEMKNSFEVSLFALRIKSLII